MLTTAEHDTPTSYLAEELVVNELLSLLWSSSFPLWSFTKDAYLLFWGGSSFLQLHLSKLSPKNGNGFHMSVYLLFFIEANAVL